MEYAVDYFASSSYIQTYLARPYKAQKSYFLLSKLRCICGKGKGKVHPRTGHERPRGGVEV